MSDRRTYKMNFGPQHPAAHGVLRLIIELDGEEILETDTHIGFLHRSIEKIMESRPYDQNTPYFDRMDYFSMMANEHGYVLSVEKLLGIKVPKRAQYIRVMFAEITRLMNHLLWLGAHGLDVGAMSMMLYCLREREDLLDMYEAASGARMHGNYFCVGGVERDLPETMPQYEPSKRRSKKDLERMNAARQGTLLDFIEDFCERFPACIDDYETLLTENRIWKQRLVGIGVVSAERAIELGFTGAMLRGSGVEWDLRKKQPYEVYDELEFDIPVGKVGDSYDRYLVRMEEMRQSVRIIKQCIKWLRENEGPVIAENHKFTSPGREYISTDMEAQIHHFKLKTEGYCVPAGEAYVPTEHPKGEFAAYVISDGANKPYRVKVRPPGFVHLAALDEMSRGHLLADMVTIIGSIDVVFGEVDR